MEMHYKLVAHQKRFLLSDKQTVVLNCGRSSGKTFIASLIAALRVKEGKRLLVWAQDLNRLEQNLLKEIAARLDEMKISYRRNFNTHVITCGNGVIYGLSYENIEACRGFTEISIAICDEIALAPPNFFGTMAFCMRGKGITPKIYCMTTPRVGSWWNDFVRKADPNEIEIINANLMSLLDKGIITQGTVDLVKSTCLDENMMRQEFYGELIEDTSTGIIFTSDLFNIDSHYHVGIEVPGYCIGIDCSGLGVDSNIILVRSETEILEIVDKRIATAAELASIVRGIVFTRGRGLLSHICIDEAYGLDLANRLEEDGLPVTLIPFGGAAENKAYANKRAELFFNLKKGLQEHGMKGLNEEIRRELQATRYKLNSSNKLQIIAKDEIKLNIGRSPDYADALALSFNQPIIPSEALESMQRAVQDAMEE